MAKLEPNPFASVARIITKDEAAFDWIADGLQHFSDGIGPPNTVRRDVSHEDYRRIIGEMLAASDTLMKYLPAFQFLPYGLKCPDEVAVMLALLPKVKALLQKANPPPRTGRRPQIRREICAQVIVELWRLTHGKAQPRSNHLLEACSEYWRVCGNGDSGDIDNWRRDAEAAAGSDDEWIYNVLIAVQNAA
jgi:hypothetical protein